MSKRPACRECERLAREYGHVMLSRVSLEERFLSAKIHHDHELAAMFVIHMHDVALELARIRQAMSDHGKDAHPE